MHEKNWCTESFRVVGNKYIAKHCLKNCTTSLHAELVVELVVEAGSLIPYI